MDLPCKTSHTNNWIHPGIFMIQLQYQQLSCCFFFLDPILMICLSFCFSYRFMQTYTFVFEICLQILGSFKPCIRAYTCSVVLCIQLNLKRGIEFLKDKVSDTNQKEAFVFSSEFSVLFFIAFCCLPLFKSAVST